MKRSLEFLLLVPILLAIVFIVVAFRNGNLNTWLSAGTPDPPTQVSTQSFAVRTSTPLIASSAIPYYTASTVPSATVTPAPTFVVVPPRTRTPIPTNTNTPLPTPTATRTSIPTRTPRVTATGTPVSQEMTDGILAGNQVVRAIEDYYLNNNKYPDSLSDLLPTYLPGLPVTPTGQPYLYRVFDASSPLGLERYWLSFRVSDQQNLTCTYMRRIEYWDCNPASP